MSQKTRKVTTVKVSYITLHYISNYGSVLQTYATQEIFKKIVGLQYMCYS